ncbi:FitA-like ribbon-helix-helix domain-containing protein [Candidatus Poriferisodalis sp.]|uniref:FitA-like ribbon-helix-helix domain-containing protein n=1 Tax=Candidatus Poriferisodalis sp. TaxID=3101277 RepID=UPI003B02E734
MATIQVRNVPDEVHEKLQRRAADSGQSLQQYMLEAVCREAELTSMEELLARKRAEALMYGDTGLGIDTIVEVIRAHRDAE